MGRLLSWSRILVVSLAGAGTAACGWGQSATLVADAHVSSALPDVNSGTLSNLNVGGGYTALVQFDLGVLPAGVTTAQITRATLKVYCNRADTAGVVSVAAMGGAWGEYSVTYASLPIAGATVASANAAAGEYVTLDVTAAVRGWVSGAAANNGLVLTSGTAVVQFDSKENDETGHAPELEIALAAGSAGVQGPVGPQGPAGPSGPAGPAGLQGIQGFAGSTGQTGPMGATGLSGLAGPAGVAGPQGAAGPAGPQGIPGPSGLTGPTGAAGPIGSQGLVGAIGPQGPVGLPGLVYRGVYASTVNYGLGDVVVFGGSSYVSQSVGNAGNTPGLTAGYWGVLTAQGAQGVAGSVGATGLTGAQGVPGSVGPPGAKGDQGLQGVAGQAGAQGIPGVVGTQGLSGPAGPQGVAGPVGLSWQGAYSSVVNYGLGDGVLWMGAGWVSVVSGNHGNTPDQSPGIWAMFAASGVAGSQGVQGPVGQAGAAGLQGPQGVAGLNGVNGAQGVAGTPGLVYQGAYSSGTNYALGDVVVFGGASYASLMAANHGNTPGQVTSAWGLLAAQGGAGPQGLTGGVGPAGAQGVQGLVGAMGTAGPQGVAGPQGPAGAQGLTGLTGAQGGVGPQGLQGFAGQAGAQGVAGPIGPAGPQGLTGAQGPAGTNGVNGAVGATGAAGAPGLVYQGAYASGTNYGVGDVVLWGGASYASLVGANVGNTPGQVASAWGVLAAQGGVGPQGLAGGVGPAGAQGVQGLVGATGAAGPQGVAGAQGPVGAQGLTGAAGAQGPAGPQGVQGMAGQAGAQGVAGATGAVGPQGPAGAQGVAGATGSAGVAGPQGAVGMNFRAGWNASNTYAVSDAVTFSGSTYLAQSANRNVEPDANASVWTTVAQAGGAGPTGPAGTAATLSLGTVTTLAAGATATVSNSGTSQAAVLNFGIPQGAAGAAGSSGTASAAGGNSFAAMYHGVDYSHYWYSVNATTASQNEDATVMAWVPAGCTASRLDVRSQQSGSIVVTLRSGTPGSMGDTALTCAPATGGSCSSTGSVTVAAGSFLDLHITASSSVTAGVWTSVTCN